MEKQFGVKIWSHFIFIVRVANSVKGRKQNGIDRKTTKEAFIK